MWQHQVDYRQSDMSCEKYMLVYGCYVCVDSKCIIQKCIQIIEG